MTIRITIYFQEQMENQPYGELSAKSVDSIPLLFGPGVVLKFGARHWRISNAIIIFPLAFKYAQNIVKQEPVFLHNNNKQYKPKVFGFHQSLLFCIFS